MLTYMALTSERPGRRLGITGRADRPRGAEASAGSGTHWFWMNSNHTHTRGASEFRCPSKRGHRAAAGEEGKARRERKVSGHFLRPDPK